MRAAFQSRVAIAWSVCLRVSGAVAPSASAKAELSRSDSDAILRRLPPNAKAGVTIYVDRSKAYLTNPGA